MGKPAARVGDAVAYGVIVQGSATVLIGSAGGVACSTCPGGMAVGNPVNPALGAKVQSGPSDLDFALPGALPVAWQRQYSSYVNVDHGPRLGLLGFGWTLPFDVGMRLTESACLLFDASGRVITFEPLLPGATLYSPSEDIHLLRGGPHHPVPRAQPPAIDLAARTTFARWAMIPPEWLADPRYLFATGPGRVAWVFVQADTERFELLGLVDRLGRRQTYRRNEAGQITDLHDGIGRHYRLIIDTVHPGRKANDLWPADPGLRLVGVDLVSDPLAVDLGVRPLVRYQYSPEGDLIGVIDRHGVLVRSFAYQRHRLVFHRERQGPEHHYVYESNRPGARVVEQHNQDGLSYRFDYLDTDNAVVVTDSLNRIDHYQFEGTGGLKRLVTHTRADGSKMAWRYDPAGRQVSQTDPLGRITHTRLDAEGRLLGMQGPDGASSTQRYDEAGQLVEGLTPAGRRTRFSYDVYGRLTEVESADGGRTGYRYPDPASAPLACEHPSEIVDAQGGVKRLQWSDAGQLLAYTDCSGRTTAYRYDAWGELLAVTDPLGGITRYERDHQGRIVALQLPDGARQSYRYDDQGRLIEEEDALGRVVAYGHDRNGRLTARRLGGTRLALDYDIAGRLTTLTNENQAETRFAYDALDRLTREIGFDGRAQAYTYDAAGQLLQGHDGNGGRFLATAYAYDNAGRLVERRTTTTDFAAAEVHRFEYDADGLLRSVTARPPEADGALPPPRLSEVLIERDALGRPLRETQRLYAGDQVEFEYALAHRYNPLGHRAGSGSDLGELDWLTYGSGHVHGLTYERQTLLDLDRDAGHREIARKFANGLSETRQLDPLGRLLGQGFGPALPERRYAYDAAGQLLGIRTPARLTTFAYDPLGRLIASRSGQEAEVRYRFDPAGNRLPDPLPEALRESLADWGERVRANLPDPDFNPIDRDPAERAATNPTVNRWPMNRIGHSAGIAYRYDVWGNRIEANHADGTRRTFGYDGLHRLVEVRAPDGTTRYRYDAFGRRLAKAVTRNGTTHTTWFGWDGDRLTRVEDDQSARETVYEPASFVPMVMLERRKGQPGAMEALLGATLKPEGDEAALARKTLAAMPREMQALMESALRATPDSGLPEPMRAALPKDFDASGAQRALLETRATLEKGTPQVTVRYFHCDHLGTPIALSDETGAVVWQARFDPWGNLIEEINPGKIEQNFRFQGQFFDQESGLHYNRHRYYDPRIGSYINQDPIGLRGGPHVYRYPQNPNTYIDPRGLDLYGYPTGRDYAEAIWNEAGDRIKNLISPVTEYCKSVVDRFKEGATSETTAGGTAVAGVGVKSTVGAAIDTSGKSCVTVATCLVVGPMAGGYTSAGTSVSSGTVTPGGSIWQFGVVGSGVAGAGVEGGLLVGSDGSLEYGYEGSLGGGTGAALLVCKKRTTEKCSGE